MRRSFLFGAAVILADAGGSSLAPGQATAVSQGPGVLLVCNGSTAPCPAIAPAIFAGNASGPGLITHSYASNMADGAFYVGACRQVCDTTLADDTGVNSALGYTGTNSGGKLVITNSVFLLNHAGVVPNSRNNDDAPPP